MPHGSSHPLGLQVHDVAGFMQDDSGTHLAAPSNTRICAARVLLQPRMVLTIEAGDFVVAVSAVARAFGKHFNWQKIEALKPQAYSRRGNVVIHENGVENMTRDLKLA